MKRGAIQRSKVISCLLAFLSFSVFFREKQLNASAYFRPHFALFRFGCVHRIYYSCMRALAVPTQQGLSKYGIRIVTMCAHHPCVIVGKQKVNLMS